MEDCKWSRMLIEKLIALFKLHENLYDREHPNYKNNALRADSIKGIAVKLRQFEPHITTAAVYRKIRVLRTQFVRELRTVYYYKKHSNAHNLSLYKPKLWCYQQLQFLKPHTMKNRNRNMVLEQLEIVALPDFSNHADADADDDDDDDDDDDEDEDAGWSDFTDSSASESGAQRLFKWSRNLTSKLITLMQQHEVLYVVTNPDYKSKKKRNNALLQIHAELQNTEKRVTVDGIRNKIHTLRTQYTKEARLVERSMRSGASLKVHYEPKLWCYKKLRFLGIPQVKQHTNANDEADNDLLEALKGDQSLSEVLEHTEVEQLENVEDFTPKEANVELSTLACEAEFIPTKPTIELEMPFNETEECPKQTNHSTKNVTDPIYVCDEFPQKHENFYLEAEDIATSSKELSPPDATINNHNLCSDDAIKMEITQNQTDRRYEWLGEQVVFEMNKIQDESLQEDAAWAIQSVLRNYVKKDKSLRRRQMQDD